jgi:hypothetical protein
MLPGRLSRGPGNLPSREVSGDGEDSLTRCHSLSGLVEKLGLVGNEGAPIGSMPVGATRAVLMEALTGSVPSHESHTFRGSASLPLGSGDQFVKAKLSVAIGVIVCCI